MKLFDMQFNLTFLN